MLKSRTITDALASAAVRDDIRPYTIWRNKLTILQLERILRTVIDPETKGYLIPWYMGFSHFEKDNDWIVFLNFPRYYRKSWRLRLTQLKRRFGRLIQNIGNRIAQ